MSYQAPQSPPNTPPIVQDFASLANIITQIQYDLFDISVTLAQGGQNQIDSRIDEKAIQWLTDIISKISGQLPPHQDPILPIGNELATNFYKAKAITQKTLSLIEQIDQSHIDPNQAKLHQEYLQKVHDFLFSSFRWSNLILKERDWYWKPKSQMPDNQPNTLQQPTLQSQPNRN